MLSAGWISYKKAVKLSLMIVLTITIASAATIFELDYTDEIAAMRSGKLNPCRRFNIWINSFLFPVSLEKYILENAGADAGYYILCYLRDLVLGSFVYWLTAAGWHSIIYRLLGKQIFTDKGRPFPTSDTIQDQMMVAQASMLLYAILPYNKATTLTPWASIAFNPMDGILQASPYVVGLFFVPVNYFVHIFLLFFTAVWATNIHDSPSDSEPFMGAKYHTYHHTHYHYNYGQFFIFCDYFWGTLKLPAVPVKKE
eukprot:gene5852-11820_t